MRSLYALATALAVSLPASSARPSVLLPPTPTVRGVVVDSAGRPLPDVQVIVNSLNRVTTTNDSGRFAFAGLPPGAYHLTALQLGYRPAHADVTVGGEGPDIAVRIVMAHARPVTQLSGVQVTATPIGTDPRDVAQSTTEVTSAQLSRTLSSSVAQTLGSEPGIAVRYNGPAASAPVIRGLSGERVLVLQDGQRAGDLSATSPDHSVSIDPLTAQRVEVVRGPASLLYGNNALGGVVNVISNDLPTSIPEHVDGFVNASTESVTPGAAAAAGVTLPVGASVAVVARGEGRRSADLRMGGGSTLPNSFFRNYSAAAGLGYVGAAGTAGLLLRDYSFTYGLPSVDDAGTRITGGRQELSGRAEFSSPPSLFTSLRVSGNAQWYGHSEVERSGAVGTRFTLRTQALDALGRTRFGRVSGAVGASGLFRQYSASGEEALTPGARSAGAGLFVYEEVPLRGGGDAHERVPTLQAGARYDHVAIATLAGQPKFGAPRQVGFDNVSGSLGVSLPLGEGISIGLSAARAFRAPTVEELFSNAFHAAVGTYDVGNPSLRTETNQGVDAILRAQRARVTGQLSAYYNRIANFITPDIVKDTTFVGPDGPDRAPLNRFTQEDARLAGAEGRVEVEVAPHAVLGAMGDVVRGAFQSGTPLPYIPPARLGVLARLDDRRLALEGQYRHAFAQTRVPATRVGSDPAGVATGAFDVIDLSATYTFDAGGILSSLTVRGDNLLDVRYRDATSRIKSFAFNPGRNVALVYRLLF